ncbi:MAG: N-acetylneuraminate synthase [Desulfobacterales bacterium]|nr:MAG: N-acetylneuraminate synthase [Desulfobacterales bacterium]
MVRHIDIAGRKIGPGYFCFIIAEAGVNHNGDMDLSKALIDVAVKAGADAVKFQTFKSEWVSSGSARKAEYQKQAIDAAESQLDMLRKLELSPEAHHELQAYCQKQGILFLSTPFDEESVDLLDEIGVPVFKIGSGEITNWPFLEYIARKGKPIILSTGMSYLSEIDQAVRVIQSAGCDKLILLHCVSSYPADPADVNLNAIKTLANAFKVPVGYSDHTLGIEISLGAVALGASMIEKHFTIDRNLPGPDHKASLEPNEMIALVKGIRALESAFGDGRKAPSPAEQDTRQVARRSLVLKHEVKAGDLIEASMLTALRPCGGIDPCLIEFVVGRRVNRRMQAGQMLTWEDLK